MMRNFQFELCHLFFGYLLFEFLFARLSSAVNGNSTNSEMLVDSLRAWLLQKETLKIENRIELKCVWNGKLARRK